MYFLFSSSSTPSSPFPSASFSFSSVLCFVFFTRKKNTVVSFESRLQSGKELKEICTHSSSLKERERDDRGREEEEEEDEDEDENKWRDEGGERVREDNEEDEEEEEEGEGERGGKVEASRCPISMSNSTTQKPSAHRQLILSFFSSPNNSKNDAGQNISLFRN
jgi:hypothetical protein